MTSSFEDYLQWRCQLDDPEVELDLSHAGLVEADLEALRPAFERALVAMRELEEGAIANPDEDRMVGHYWLRSPGRAPEPAMQDAIVETLAAIELFAQGIHADGKFRQVVVCGIGGSALGPMLVADALDGPNARMSIHVLDNTDPAGVDRLLARLGDLTETLILTISKSGTTPEPRNCMLEMQRACASQGLAFAERAIAVTGEGSALWQRAEEEGWLAVFPMWDWVGGRTSVLSAVGLVPAALQGLDLRGLLAGAAAMDECTRRSDLRKNPAVLLALYWHHEGQGRGQRDMVVLPYKDELLLFSRYLQQLVMESLGKRLDRGGNTVHQGLAVYGNKGSTDQHAFVQQLRDGLHNFFTVFVRVLHDRDGEELFVEEGVTSGDYLDGFYQGTRRALLESGRTSATLTIQRLDERSLAALIALFERAVGIYAELLDINAYHQPGVEAGKKAAGEVLALQAQVLGQLSVEPQSVATIAASLSADALAVWNVLQHLVSNRAEVHGTGLAEPAGAVFRLV
jgi:glucose-6-phosphate isomerase